MKKSVLFASLLALCSASASAEYKAVSDGCTYENVDNMEIKSMWIRANGTSYGDWTPLWTELPFANSNYARTACIKTSPDGDGANDKIIVSWEEINADDNNTGTLGMMSIFNLHSGELEKTMQLTLDGTQLHNLLCANQVGCDDFGNVWICGYVATPYDIEKGKANPFVVYSVDLETGALTKQFEVTLPAEEKEATGRCDYYGLVGDVTRQEAVCCFMTAPNDSKRPYVYGWKFEQGSDEATPLMDGESFVSKDVDETFPADQAAWGTGSLVRILKDEDFSASMFYTDGFVTCPTLYDNSCALMESFASAIDLSPKVGTNGVAEFSLNGRNFIMYSLEQYNDGATCRANICELGENQSFEGMKLLWTVPETGLGTTSDGGNRYHACETKVYTDKDGVEGAYVLSFKGRNGMAVYTVAPIGWDNPYGAGVDGIMADDNSNAPVEYFNINGVEVSSDNLVPGLYITRQGTKTAKVVVK